jgi:CNT family concentrative nucleoside transporter
MVIFFNAFVQMLYYYGIMQWVIKNFAWFFFKTLNVSGAEAVVAAASPFVGEGESACLVRPFIDLMTESEIHLIMTSGKLSYDWADLTSVEPFKDSPQLLALS